MRERRERNKHAAVNFNPSQLQSCEAAKSTIPCQQREAGGLNRVKTAQKRNAKIRATSWISLLCIGYEGVPAKVYEDIEKGINSDEWTIY